jgi:hypothetical protein
VTRPCVRRRGQRIDEDSCRKTLSQAFQLLFPLRNVINSRYSRTPWLPVCIDRLPGQRQWQGSHRLFLSRNCGYLLLGASRSCQALRRSKVFFAALPVNSPRRKCAIVSRRVPGQTRKAGWHQQSTRGYSGCFALHAVDLIVVILWLSRSWSCGGGRRRL